MAEPQRPAPTMKPVGLIQYQIENNTKGEDVVLDLLGLGYTLIACEKKGAGADDGTGPVLLRRDHSAVAGYSGQTATRESERAVTFDALVAAATRRPQLLQRRRRRQR